jgi:hypothetical protein
MTKTHRDAFKIQRYLSSILVSVGLLLLVFMITVESEPGALPLLLFLSGVVWNVYIRLKQKRSGSEVN